MSEDKSKDPGAVWRDQPEEKLPVNLEHLVNRRTEELSSSTRSEILMTVGAAVLLLAVVAWRLQIAREGLLEWAIAAVAGWVAITLYAFRRRIWAPRRPDAVAAAGLDYYCAELQRRRDHLKNEWLWHGPLALATIILIGVFTGVGNIAFQPLRNVLPLLVLLVVWAGYGFWRRRQQARELQREIDEVCRYKIG